MRVDDRPIPAIVGPRPPAGLPGELFVAIERLPVSLYAWDDETAEWDDAAGRYVWDDVEGEYLADATCDLRGLVIEVGNPDAEGRVEAGHVELTIDNRTGQWSTLDAFGRLIYHAPGRTVDVWARHAGVDYWLFSGAVTGWDERPEGVVEVEAFDVLSDLNQPIGEWSPGTAGQHPGERLDAILDLIGFEGRRRFAPGDVTLHAWLTTATPLEEMQSVAVSDAGVLGVDADGTLMYLGRGWPLGRTDQTAVPIFTDNVCPTPPEVGTVWDYNPLTDDDRVYNVVTLTNVEGVTATARDQSAVDLYRAHPLTRTNDQWMTAGEGSALAAYLVTRGARPQVRIEGFTLHVHDPQQDLWRMALDLRLGDLIRFVHDQATVEGPHRLDANYAVARLRWDITPASWVLEVGTPRQSGTNPLARWDTPGVLWDDDPPDLWTF